MIFTQIASSPGIEIKQPSLHASISYAIVFLSDLTYVHNSTLSSEFDQIAAELEAAEREEEAEKDEKSVGEESDEVCAPFRPFQKQVKSIPSEQHSNKSNQFRT